jgi:hypothetical protein
VRAGRAQRDPARRHEREQPHSHVALARDRVVEVLAPAGADLDLGRDQLACDRLRQHAVLRDRGVAQFLEPRHELERPAVEDGELLLDADGEVGRRREDLLGAVQVDGGRPHVR